MTEIEETTPSGKDASRRVGDRTASAFIGLLAIVGIVSAIPIGPERPGAIVLLSVAGALLAVVVLQMIWAFTGGEPVRRQIEAMRSEVRALHDVSIAGIDRVHRQRQEVSDEMVDRWSVLGARAKRIDLLGLTLDREWLSNDDLLAVLKQVAEKRQGQVRLLLLPQQTYDPRQPPAPAEGEVPAENLSFEARVRQPGEEGGGVLLGYIQKAHRHLGELTNGGSGSLEIRTLRFCMPYCLIIRIDDYMYVAPYRASTLGEHSLALEVHSAPGHSVFEMYRREFEAIWTAEAPSAPSPSAAPSEPGGEP